MATSLKKKKKRKKFIIISNRTIHIKATLTLSRADRTTKISKTVGTAGEDGEEGEPSFTAGGTANADSRSGNPCGECSKH